MKPLAHLAVLAVSAALAGALPAGAEESDSKPFAKLEADFASWQAEQNAWSDYAYEGSGGDCCDVGCSGDVGCGGVGCGGCRTSGIIAGVEMPLLKAHYGACGVDVPGLFQLPEMTPSFDHETTPRFWLGVKSCDGLAMRFRYWEYDHSASAVDVPNRYYVDMGLEAGTFDFEIAQTADFCNWQFEIGGGARWAKIDDDIHLDYDGDPVSWSRSFEGGGPTFAVAVRRQLGIGQLALVGNFRASLIYGDTDLGLDFDLGLDADTVAVGIDDQLVEIYEIQVGAEWSRMMCGGYRVAGRVVLEAQAWELAPGPGPLGLFDTNIGFVGPSFALSIER
jgi:hypothetical protein